MDHVDDSQCLSHLIQLLTSGDCSRVAGEVRHLLEQGVDRETIIIDGIEKALELLDAKCTVAEFNLLEIMLVGRAAMAAMKEIYPHGSDGHPGLGAVVIATLEGDVHDIGKNIVKMILSWKGYRVVDCGKDCPLKLLIETAVKERPLAVFVSGLITTVIPLVGRVRESLVARGLDEVVVVAGGAALKQLSADQLQVDYVAPDVFSSLRFLEHRFGGVP
jgi:methylmalonyl-CoA mutase cobalamin-binding domain/chain